MNTTENTVVASVKAGRGRPRNPNSDTHYHSINLHPDTKKPFGKGRLPDGTKVFRVKIAKNVKCADFVYGVTPIVSSDELVIGYREIPASNNANVVVTEALAESAEPIDKAENLVEIPV